MSDPILRLADVRRTYHPSKAIEVAALRGVTLDVARGEFVTIVGPSGSGKTTLLNVCGLLDHADAGEITIDGQATSDLNDRNRTRVRREKVGFIFQSFNLLPHLTARENVAVPLRYADGGARRSPAELLERVGLGERLTHRPDELSGGEQQRVAIARALVLDAPILLADEPTGELDSETANGIHELLFELKREGKTLVIVTHNEELAKISDRGIHMRDGDIEKTAAGGAQTRRRRPRGRRGGRGRGGGGSSGSGSGPAGGKPKGGAPKGGGPRGGKPKGGGSRGGGGRSGGSRGGSGRSGGGRRRPGGPGGSSSGDRG